MNREQAEVVLEALAKSSKWCEDQNEIKRIILENGLQYLQDEVLVRNGPTIGVAFCKANQWPTMIIAKRLREKDGVTFSAIAIPPEMEVLSVPFFAAVLDSINREFGSGKTEVRVAPDSMRN